MHTHFEPLKLSTTLSGGVADIWRDGVGNKAALIGVALKNASMASNKLETKTILVVLL